MPNQIKRDGKKAKGRVMDTNVRVSKSTHRLLKALTDELGVGTMSDAIDFVIFEHYPQIEQKLKAAEERKKLLDSKRSQLDN